MKMYVQLLQVPGDGFAVATTNQPAEPAWEVEIPDGCSPSVEQIWGAASMTAENGGGDPVTKLVRTIALYRAVARKVLGVEPEPEVPVPVEWLWAGERKMLLEVIPPYWGIRERIRDTAGLGIDRRIVCHSSRSGAQGICIFGFPEDNPRPWPGIEVVHRGPHNEVRWSTTWTAVVFAPTTQPGRWWRDTIAPALQKWAEKHNHPVIAYDRNGDWVLWVPAEKAEDLTRYLQAVRGYRLAARSGDNLKFHRLREEEAVAVGLGGANGYYV